MIKKIFSYKISTATFFSLIISFIYFLIVVIISGKHEFWGDEINTWLAVRDMAKPELFKFMLWDGHPILHYMVFSIFADLGLTLHSVQLFFCLISAAGIFILYRFCSFCMYRKKAEDIICDFLLVNCYSFSNTCCDVAFFGWYFCNFAVLLYKEKGFDTCFLF